MFAVALVIMFMGVYTVEGTGTSLAQGQDNATIFNNTLKVVSSQATLRLLHYSAEIENQTSKCLVSRFINTTIDGAQRTFETNVKFSKPSNENRTYIHSKTNITITLHVGEYPPHYFPRLFISEHSAHLIPNDWKYDVDVVHAESGCFILKVPFAFNKTYPCVLWGSGEENECLNAFLRSCSSGKGVDLDKCEEAERRKDAN